MYDALVLGINSRLESVVALLLKWPGLDVNQHVNERTTKSTPLTVEGTLFHQAYKVRNTANIMQQLVSAGADINMQERKSGTWGNGTWTVNPLHNIVSSVDSISDDSEPTGRVREIHMGETVACAEILTKAGLDANTARDLGQTPVGSGGSQSLSAHDQYAHRERRKAKLTRGGSRRLRYQW
ncbi:hypothetical protein S40285_06084 [Stachybotrys chlorohalonatus IBT 40285]|uniref:Uncharacterized protein n=1 Tax=Stachybotrys chlorohalonatus (strain IBT 40285) TaxID=1283841 RepID=A0A084QEQ7_STAC4|nr:hypothetical protein S40285_06084 [Stachybotrys chlorohalonata IBT 40285]